MGYFRNWWNCHVKDKHELNKPLAEITEIPEIIYCKNCYVSFVAYRDRRNKVMHFDSGHEI
jgi:hypothetical protein